MTGYMRLDILHCDALVNNKLLLHIVCFFVVVGSLNSTVVNQLHRAQCTSTFFSILKPNCIIECTSPHNLCAIHGHADNKCKEIGLNPKSFFLQTSHLIFKLTFCFSELFSLKPSLFGPFYIFCSQYLWVLAMLRQRSYFAGTTAEHLQCPCFPSAPTLCFRWSPRLTNIYVSGQRFHRQNSYFAEPAKLGADQCHCDMWLVSLEYIVNSVL